MGSVRSWPHCHLTAVGGPSKTDKLLTRTYYEIILPSKEYNGSNYPWHFCNCKYELNMFQGMRLIRVFVLICFHYLNDLNGFSLIKNKHLCVFIEWGRRQSTRQTVRCNVRLYAMTPVAGWCETQVNELQGSTSVWKLQLYLCTPWIHSSTHSYPRQPMETSGQLQALATSSPGTYWTGGLVSHEVGHKDVEQSNISYPYLESKRGTISSWYPNHKTDWAIRAST